MYVYEAGEYTHIHMYIQLYKWTYSIFIYLYIHTKSKFQIIKLELKEGHVVVIVHTTMRIITVNTCNSRTLEAGY